MGERDLDSKSASLVRDPRGQAVPLRDAIKIIIEAVWGLGEAVVSGHATPDHYVVSRDGAVKQARVSVQEFAVRADVSGGVRQYPLTAEEGGARVLDDAELAALAKVGRQLEADFGRPLDVEWAFEGGHLYLLQSRPVTA